MIYFEAPYFSFEGLQVFRDHADPLQYYYFPQQPRLALNPDGTPTFLFIKFREDLSNPPQGVEPGGGFLNFDVDLRVDDDTLATVTRKIQQAMNLSDKPRLAPIDYRNGRTRLILLDGVDPNADPNASPGATPTPVPQPTTAGGTPQSLVFVEKEAYSVTPSLYGDNRAAFSVQLSPAGATLVEKTLDAATSLIGVVYDLTFVGLRPAYKIRLTIAWDRVYDYLDQKFNAGARWYVFAVDTDIESAVEKLIETQAIKLDVISFGAGASDKDIIAEKDAAVQFVRKFITDKFFEPSIPPKGLDGAWTDQIHSVMDQMMPVHASYSYKHLNREDAKKLQIDLTEESATEMRIVPQGHLEGLMDVLRQFPRDDFVREIDLADPFFQQVKVNVVGGAAIGSDQVDHVEFHAEYGPDGAGQPQDLLLDSAGATSTVQWALIPHVGLSYNYRYHVYFKPNAPAGQGTNIQSPVLQSNATKLVIDPRDLYQIQKVNVQAINLPFDRYSQVEVALRYVDAVNNLTLKNDVMLTKNSQSGDWSFRVAPGISPSYQYQLTYFPTLGAPLVEDWVSTNDPAVLVTDPTAGTRPLVVTVMPAGDFNKILRILVNMTYDDNANNVHQSDLLKFVAATDSQDWTVRIANPNSGAYVYQVSVLYKDGTTKQFPAIPSTERVLFVGDIFQRTVHVKVTLAGHSFEDAELAKVRVRLSYDDPANQIHSSQEGLLTSLSDSFVWDYQIKDPTMDSYTFQVTYIRTDGFQNNQPPRTSNVELLVVPIQ
ncbi:MAG: hypothetical protein WCF84_08360 [Anaerolineae bacterium]